MCALLHAGSKCAICSGSIDRSQPLFATSGVVFPRSDPLWKFCDAPIHWDCYATWGPRPRFARAYFDSWVEAEQTSAYWSKAYLDNMFLVTVNPAPPVEEAHVHLSGWGTRDIVKLKDWSPWLADEAGFVKHRHPGVQIVWNYVFPILRERLPTVESLLAQVDWDLKARRAAELEKRAQVSKDVVQRTLDQKNREAADLADRMRRDGLACPKCGRRGNDFRVMEGLQGRRSYLVCIGCGGSVWPDDLPKPGP